MRASRRKMRASVGSGLLNRMDRLFADDLRLIAIELMHLARRAEATNVTVTTDPDDQTVTLSHDGSCPLAEEAGALLVLGGDGRASGPGGFDGEDGLGLLSLAHRGAVVRGADWEMIVPPDAFAGRAEATLLTGRRWRRGVAVTFVEVPCHEAAGRSAVRALFDQVAEAMPFAMVVDESAVRRRRPMDALLDERGRWTVIERGTLALAQTRC